jgi:DNA-binding transcriptional LysR family regulator
MIEWDGPIGRNEPFLSHHNSNWIDPDTNSALSDQRFKIVGTKGRIECDQRNRGIELARQGAGVALINPYYADFLPDVDGNLEFQGYSLKSIARFMADVVMLKRGETSLSHLDKTRPSLRQALVSTAVIDAVNRALCAGPAWRAIDDFS